jgi:thiol:disulfide interchange protein
MFNDRILVGVLILAAALWLRQRARRLVPGQRKKALLGLLAFLIPALLIWRWGVDRFPLEHVQKVSVEIAGLAVIFAVMAYVFVRPEKEQKE